MRMGKQQAMLQPRVFVSRVHTKLLTYTQHFFLCELFRTVLIQSIAQKQFVSIFSSNEYSNPSSYLTLIPHHNTLI